jgi:hypothetical protein
MRFVRAFDRWITSGSFTARDLGVYRILFAVLLLALPRRFSWIDRFPSSLFQPPPGPFQLASGLPPHGFFDALEIAIILAALMMGIGLLTRWSSLLLSVLLIVGYGFSYSFGKIDHTILLLIAPAVLSFSNWGAALSVDSVIRSRGQQVNQWAVRLFALTISLSFATAALAKIGSGWLLLDSQIVKGYVLRRYFTVEEGRNAVADLAASIQAPWLWELLDWGVVALEIALAVGFLSWRLLRVSLAAAAIFHIGIHLLLGISFYWNLVAYAAFVPWGRLPLRIPERHRVLSAALGACVLFALAVVGMVVVSHSLPTPFSGLSEVILWAGTAVGAGYLVYIAVLLVRWLIRGRPTAPARPRPAPLSRAGSLTLRVAFVVLVLTLPLTLIVDDRFEEPYPALVQPDFNGPGPLRNDRVLWTRPVITVRFEDGTATIVRARDVIPSPVAPDTVFSAGFYDQDRANDPTSSQWLRRLIEARYAPAAVERLTIEWVQNRYDPVTGELKWTKLIHTTEIQY